MIQLHRSLLDWQVIDFLLVDEIELQVEVLHDARAFPIALEEELCCLEIEVVRVPWGENHLEGRVWTQD